MDKEWKIAVISCDKGDLGELERATEAHLNKMAAEGWDVQGNIDFDLDGSARIVFFRTKDLSEEKEPVVSFAKIFPKP